MQQIGAGTFPFKLEDLRSWTVKRTDGTVTKFVLVTADVRPSAGSQTSAVHSHGAATQRHAVTGYSAFCTHTPTKQPIVEFARSASLGGALKLHIGNMSGARSTFRTFDFVVDCGDILRAWDLQSDVLVGDKALVEELLPYTNANIAARVLKIDWDDRAAAPVSPEFWPKLSESLYGDVMTCCVGGHGRSGTSFVCLLLANAPEYDALDAILHVRAVHCPRAIESKEQHEYIDSVAKFLGREANANKISEITDYKAAFKASDRATAVKTREMLKWL